MVSISTGSVVDWMLSSGPDVIRVRECLGFENRCRTWANDCFAFSAFAILMMALGHCGSAALEARYSYLNCLLFLFNSLNRAMAALYNWRYDGSVGWLLTMDFNSFALVMQCFNDGDQS